MKKLFGFLITMSVFVASCEKDGDASCDLPSTSVPEFLVGNWANGYNSFTQIVDTYNGQYLGNAWQSGKSFRFESNGKNAEFYYMATAGFSASTATRAIGTVEFHGDGSFTFHACKAHYKGWQGGTLTVDRDATSEELANNLTRRYYYTMTNSGGNTWMEIRFEPGTGTTPTSFRNVP
jgi:hypothetical protein